MTESKLSYIGPTVPLIGGGAKKKWLERVPWAFVIIVGMPSFIAAIYFLLVASPQYVSEARFIVRNSGGGGTPSAFGVALQGVGLSGGQTEAFAVHEYITSAQAVEDLRREVNIEEVLRANGADPFSRYPRLGEKKSVESLQSALNRYVVVGYDSTTGISTLRVQSFRPEDSRRIARVLLSGGERLVNKLNERSRADTLSDATRARADAKARLEDAQRQITAYRNRQQTVDPGQAAVEVGRLVGELMASAIELKAERAQIAMSAPDSPRLPALDARIAAYDRQIAEQRAELAGSSSSLAPAVGQYEELVRQRDFATEELAQTTRAYLTAEQEARRQNLYLERVVEPSLPQEPKEPKRLLAILAVFGTMILIYGLGLLIWTGFREHRQA